MKRSTLTLAAISILNVAWLFAQTPSIPTAPSSIAIPDSPSSNIPVFQFQIRTAFTLTPGMVSAIQSASLGSQGSKAAPGESIEKANSPKWEDAIVREVSLASPLGIKIQNDRFIAIIVLMPIELIKKDITMLVQNHIYMRSQDNSIQLNTSVHTVRIPVDSVFYYYPLGGDSKQGAPMVIEILVNSK
ncbi:MAG: hypothetical protein KBB90_03315 [Spirochaetia bacterium]|jgi:hypothetical protein|nr:hypothetical protein [Spirochaetia bacterium]